MCLHLDNRIGNPVAVALTAVVRIDDASAVATREAGVVALANQVDRLRRLIVAEPVPPVVRRPQLVGPRAKGDAHGVAQAIRVDGLIAAVGAIANDGRPTWVALDTHVTRGADRDVEPRPVGAEEHRARVMPAARQAVDDDLGLIRSRRIATQRDPHHPRGLAHIERSIREEGQAARRRQPGGDDLHTVGEPVRVAIRQSYDATGPSLRDIEVPVGSHGHHPRPR